MSPTEGKNNMIYILVPVYKRLEETILFVASIESTFASEYMLIITDDSPDYEHYNYFSSNSNITVVKGNGELYWGGGINACIEFLASNVSPRDGDIVVFANNDVTLGEGFYNELVPRLSGRQRDCILHPVLYDQDGRRLVAGSKIVAWLPFITRHDCLYGDELIEVDIASARFLAMRYETLRKVGGINKKLPHYGGDNDFVLRAKNIGIKTFVVRGMVCKVDEQDTGVKVSNAVDFKEFYLSFFSIKSPNAIKYRYRFVKSHFGPLYSTLIVVGMTFKAWVGYVVSRFNNA